MDVTGDQSKAYNDTSVHVEPFKRSFSADCQIEVFPHSEITRYEDCELQTDCVALSDSASQTTDRDITHNSTQTKTKCIQDGGTQTTPLSQLDQSIQTRTVQCHDSQTETMVRMDTAAQCDSVSTRENGIQVLVKCEHSSQQTESLSMQHVSMQTTYEFTESVEVQVEPNSKERAIQTDNHMAQHKSTQVSATSVDHQVQCKLSMWLWSSTNKGRNSLCFSYI